MRNRRGVGNLRDANASGLNRANRALTAGAGALHANFALVHALGDRNARRLLRVAANAVDLREPLKPALPAELQLITPPRASAIETCVLLNVERMNAIPAGIDLPDFFAFSTTSPSAGAAVGSTGA